MNLIAVDPNLCACPGACIDSCPYGLIFRGAEDLPEGVPDAARSCIRCGQCVAVCPTGALANRMFKREDFQEQALLDAKADPLGVLMLSRRSIRAFKPEPISRSELAPLLELASRAPTANNAQNLWWIVTTGEQQTRALALLARDWMREAYPGVPASMFEGDTDPVLRGAPQLVLCCGPEDSKWGHTDAAIAVTHLDLLLSSRGHGACWAGVFLRAVEAWPPLVEALALPAGQKVYGGLFFGRPKHRYRLVPPRKPLAVDWR